jgi:hypothetical protein
VTGGDAPRRVRVAGDLFHGRVPAGAVYVGRGAPGLPASPYRNRHRAGPCRPCGVEHDRAGAVAAYARDLAARPALVAAARAERAGADLACWCRPGELCHADVLLSVVGGAEPQAAHRAAPAQPCTQRDEPSAHDRDDTATEPHDHDQPHVSSAHDPHKLSQPHYFQQLTLSTYPQHITTEYRPMHLD